MIIFGRRYEYDDADFKQLLIMINKFMQHFGDGTMIFRHIRYLQPQKVKSITENLNQLHQFLRKIVGEHHTQYDPKNPRDYIDVFLTEIKLQKSHLNEKTLISTIQALFIGGSHTITTTLRWALLYMIAYPEIQRQVQQELDTYVGLERLPRLSDIPNLPYTRAVLFEVQRIATVAPLGFTHSAADDTTLCGFSIPKGAVLVSNIWAVHNDPKLWREPTNFDPSRFLDSSGSLLERPEWIPFSTGIYKTNFFHI